MAEGQQHQRFAKRNSQRDGLEESVLFLFYLSCMLEGWRLKQTEASMKNAAIQNAWYQKQPCASKSAQLEPTKANKCLLSAVMGAGLELLQLHMKKVLCGRG